LSSPYILGLSLRSRRRTVPYPTRSLFAISRRLCPSRFSRTSSS
jgi:hypothetical protein